MQARFVEAFTSGPSAGNGTKAAIAAGYSKRTAAQIGCQLLKLSHVVAAIDAVIREEISTTLTVQAVTVIRTIITDEKAPLKLRGEMAARVVEYSGVIERAKLEKARQTGLDARTAPGDKRLGEMSRGELEALVQAGAAVLHAAAAIPKPGPLIEGTARDSSAKDFKRTAIAAE
jgi:phage terminase small subunit